MELKWTDSTVRTGGIASGPIFERSCWVDFEYSTGRVSTAFLGGVGEGGCVGRGEMIWRLAAISVPSSSIIRRQ
jgi:hypothetical protein